MGKKRVLGEVKPIDKVWLSKKELCAYLGVSDRYIEATFNLNPKIEVYRISERIYLYNKQNIDEMIEKSKI